MKGSPGQSRCGPSALVTSPCSYLEEPYAQPESVLEAALTAVVSHWHSDCMVLSGIEMFHVRGGEQLRGCEVSGRGDALRTGKKRDVGVDVFSKKNGKTNV